MTLEEANEIVQDALVRAMKCIPVSHSKKLDNAMRLIDESREKLEG